MKINLKCDRDRPLIRINKMIVCPRCESHIELDRMLRMSIWRGGGYFVFYETCEICGNRIMLKLPFTFDPESHWVWDSDFHRECDGAED